MMMHAGLLASILMGAIAANEPTQVVHLFNGQNLDGFYTFIKDRGRDQDPKAVFTVQDGVIRISGEEWGCITSNEEFENYRLVVEYKWGELTHGARVDKARDSGVLVHSVGEDGGYGGIWMHSIECQLIEGGSGDVLVVGDGSDAFSATCATAPQGSGNAHVFQPGGEAVTLNGGRFDWWGRDPGWQDVKGFRGARDVEKPIGEWNRIECIAKGSDLTVVLNGIVVNHCTRVKPSKGRIQIQSEAAEIFVRRVDVLPLEEAAAAPVADGRISAPELPQPGLELYVAPGGADTNPGTEAAPFATLERARDEIRSVRGQGGVPSGGVCVNIAGGAYAVSRTLTLAADDSGTAEAPITYRAAGADAPVFSGGMRLSGFAPVADEAVLARLPEEARGQVVQVDLKLLGLTELPPLVLGGFASGSGFKTHPVSELFFDGEALPMARYPNEGMLATAGICVEDGHTIHGMTGSKVGRILYEGDRPARWKDEADAMLYGYWFFDWADSYERIVSIDIEKREIGFAEPWHTYGYRKGARYYAVNLLSEIDMPGEWYLDRKNALVYLYPPSDPAKAVVELSVLSAPMIEMDGVSHVRFEGITWELGSADAILVKGGEKCLFAGCTVRRFGGNGIEIQGGSQHGILSCDIYSMGRGGTVIAGGDRKTLAPSGHFVANCDIHHLSRIDHTYTPAVVMGGVGGRIAHNRFHDINSSAIRLNGNDHLVEFNETHDVLLESDDQGGADMWGDATFRGNVYRFNYWHHIGNWRRIGEDLPCGQAGIRLDDAISGVLIFGNIFHHCASGKLGFGGVQIHGGKDNLIENCIFAECESAISFSPWGEKRWKDFVGSAMASVAIDPDLYLSRYPDLATLEENADINTVRRNIVWECGRFLHRDSGKTLLADNLIADTGRCFEDAAAGDFRLTGDVASLATRFQPIPLEVIGLYKDGYRRSLPEQEIKQARARTKE